MRHLFRGASFALAVTGLLAASPALTSEATVSHGISAFGELKYGPDFAHFDYVNPDAPKGGEISLMPAIATNTFDNFNPYILKGDPPGGAHLYLYDTLMVRAYDEPDALYGLVAETVEMPEDRRWVIFNLREEARFSDGSPLTAADVAWSIETLRDGTDPRFSVPLRPVETITVMGSQKVRFDFESGAATRDLPALIAQSPIFSKAYFADKDFSEPKPEPPLNSGPYEVADFVLGRSITYRRRDDYWAKDLAVVRGKYNFDMLRYEYFRDRDAGFEAFASDAYTFREEFTSKTWATRYDFSAIQKGWVIREAIYDGRASGTQAFWYNLRRDKFADVRVRQALGMAFDFEWTNKRLFYDLYSRTTSFFQGTDLMADGLPTPAEQALLMPFKDQLPDSVFGEAVMPTKTNGSGRIRRQVRAASQLLEEAGWKAQNGQRVNAAGEVLRIEFLDRAGSGFRRIVDPYIQNLEALGVEATLRQVDAAQYERLTKAYEFDIVTARLPLTQTPGPELRGFLSSAAAEAPGSLNLAGVSSPVVDALLDNIADARSREDLQTAARALDRVLRATHVWVPQWGKASHTVAWWDRFGRPQDLGIDKPPYDRAVISTWWYDQERADALAQKMDQ
ncbi:MAG: extracellular solute-binding protein [Pseudomonadota bacterium]